jgi:hypothetical protein
MTYKHYLKELQSTEEALPQCIATTYHLLRFMFPHFRPAILVTNFVQV